MFKGTESAEAFELYQKGRSLWQTRNGKNLHDATVLLEQAVQKDTNFALAHSALADCYAFDYANWKKSRNRSARSLKARSEFGRTPRNHRFRQNVLGMEA